MKGRNLYMTLLKSTSASFKRNKQYNTTESVQLTISQQITHQLGKDMKKMSHTITSNILGGMHIGYKK